jgi:hypothetical protein
LKPKSQAKWCAIDCEGDVGNKGLLGVAFYSDKGSQYLTDHQLIKRDLTDLAQNGYTFIAHNAEYDLPVIFWQLGIPIKAVYFNGRFNRGEWRYDVKRKMCQLWDTMALSGGLSLAALGIATNCKKYSTPQRLLGYDPDRYHWFCDTHDRGECEECYAIRDAEICYKFMESLTDQLSAWGVQPHRRLSGLASHVWRVLDRPEPIGLTDYHIQKLARESYHGGRTETFKLGTISPCYTADVTSMYPSVMAATPYPDPQSMMYIENGTTWEWLSGHEGCADVSITIPPLYLPPLPYNHNGLLHYPIGCMRGVWTLLELRYAVQHGAIIHRVYSAAFSENIVYPFQSFIDILWSMRCEYQRTNDPRHLFAKLLMNNLYGYLGMGTHMERTDISMARKDIHIKHQPKSQWYTQDGTLYLTYIRDQPSSNKWSNVLWASQTTAAARIKLHQVMTMQGDSLLYCDTDSVFSSNPIVGLSEGLGGLRSDGDYQQCIISAPKLYALQDYDGKWQAKAKGVSRRAALEFLRTGTATFSVPVKPQSQGRLHIPAGTWIDVERNNQHALARRQPLNPSALLNNSGWSDTAPLVCL